MPQVLTQRFQLLRKLAGVDDENSNADVEVLLSYLATTAAAIRVEWSEELAMITRGWVAAADAPRVGAYRTYLTFEEWSVQSIVSGGQEVARVLRVPTIAEVPRVPSAGQEVLLAALLYCEDATFVDLLVSPGQIVVQWFPASAVKSNLESVIVAAAGALGQDEVPYRVTTTKTSQIELASRLAEKSDHELKFLARAYRSIAVAGEVRWQYLSVYRVFEHAWLRTIFGELTKDFMQDPESALKGAQDALASERSQFERTVALHDVKAEFADFRSKFDALVKSNNRFCTAIGRRVEQEKNTLKQEDGWRVGVRTCYQIRCAIVHAGASGPYYENFDDADEAVRELLGGLELAMQKFVGMGLA